MSLRRISSRLHGALPPPPTSAPLPPPKASSPSMGPQQDRTAPSKAYGNGGAGAAARARRKEEGKAVRYRECQRNHAASVGGYAVDGCREFMASGADGTAAALLCAACGCHRSFHRREQADAADHCDCSSDAAPAAFGDRR